MREAMCDVEGTAMLAQMGREGLHEDTCAAWGPPAVASDRKNSCREPEEERRKGHPGQ